MGDYTGFSSVRLIHAKRETADAIIQMIGETEYLLNSKVSPLFRMNRNVVNWIRSDGGGKFVGLMFQNFLNEKRTVSRVATPKSRDWNAAERLNWLLLDTARIIMTEVLLSRQDMWAEEFKNLFFFCEVG